MYIGGQLSTQFISIIRTKQSHIDHPDLNHLNNHLGITIHNKKESQQNVAPS